jgi:hypothetical protein
MASPLIKMVAGALIKKVVGTAVVSSATDRLINMAFKPKTPPSNSRKDTPMNPVFLGTMRHLIQLGAGAVGMTAYASGSGFELLVAVAVSTANLAWFAFSNWSAARKA